VRDIINRQSQLSLASALYYLVGGVISMLAATVFNSTESPLNFTALIISLLGFFTAAVFVVTGRRFPPALALAFACLSASLVLVMALLTPLEIRAMNPALLFYATVIYLVWFGPMLLARIFGYTWLLLYASLMLSRFGGELAVFVITLILTSPLIVELVGAYKRRLEIFSLTDPLCGVWNTRGFSAVIEREAMVVRRTEQPLSLVYIDLDDLKRVNDTQGHAAGDRLLRNFTHEIERITRPQDSIARLGGDEFAVLMPSTDLAQAIEAVTRLRSELTVNQWSFGVAQFKTGDTPAELIARADQRMLEDKRQRKAERGAAESPR